MRKSYKGIVSCDASGIYMWECVHCDKRIYSLYKNQLEANIMAHLRTHEKELAKSAMKSAKRRGRKIQTDKSRKVGRSTSLM